MKYTVLSNLQLFLLSIVIAILAGLLVCVNNWYMVFSALPVVHTDKNGSCIRVENFENGQSFTCQDVDVLLRRYRKQPE